jgi:hypothetical protein
LSVHPCRSEERQGYDGESELTRSIHLVPLLSLTRRASRLLSP